MADDPKPPDGKEGTPTPPAAAADKPASPPPAEPPGGLKAEVSRTDPPSPAASGPVVPKPPTAAPPAAGGPVAPKPPAAAPPAAKAEAHAPKASAPVGPPDQPPPAGTAPPPFITALQAAVPDGVLQVSYWVGDWAIIVPVARLLDVARHLRDASDAAFDMCSDVTATDWPLRPERFDLVYCLYSTRHRHRIRVKAKAGEQDPVPSMTAVWPGANWLEREVYDMFGVNITGHPDRRRILMPDDWQGFPQRKDYPLEGPGELLMENPLDWLKLRQERDEADIE
jgi:NADH-quinone oxidoreductase subunit C